MSRWRVIEVVCDSSFGYAPAPVVDVVKDMGDVDYIEVYKDYSYGRAHI